MNTTFRDVIPHSPVEFNWWFGRTYCLKFLFDSTFLTMLDLLFDADDGSNTFLRNVCILLPHYTAIHPRNAHSLPSMVFCCSTRWYLTTGHERFLPNHSTPHNTNILITPFPQKHTLYKFPYYIVLTLIIHPLTNKRQSIPQSISFLYGDGSDVCW